MARKELFASLSLPAETLDRYRRWMQMLGRELPKEARLHQEFRVAFPDGHVMVLTFRIYAELEQPVICATVQCPDGGYFGWYAREGDFAGRYRLWKPGGNIYAVDVFAAQTEGVR